VINFTIDTVPRMEVIAGSNGVPGLRVD
jgi:hypothetical protein